MDFYSVHCSVLFYRLRTWTIVYRLKLASFGNYKGTLEMRAHFSEHLVWPNQHGGPRTRMVNEVSTCWLVTSFLPPMMSAHRLSFQKSTSHLWLYYQRERIHLGKDKLDERESLLAEFRISSPKRSEYTKIPLNSWLHTDAPALMVSTSNLRSREVWH